MDESHLNHNLKALSRRPIPDLPSNLNDSVFARIRVMESTAVREHWLDASVSRLLRPQWAIVVLVITLAIGGDLGRVLANSEPGPAHAPLGLDVFTADAPTLPSTVLSKSR
jgi:hypothetical protein